MPIVSVLPALTIIAILSIALFVISYVAGRRRRRAAIVIAVASAGALLVNALWLLDNLLLAQAAGGRDVIVYGNIMLPMTAALAGAALPLMPGAIWKRLVLVVPLIGIGLWRTGAPLLRPAPPLKSDRWTSGVCRQSSLASCSAAAAATALRAVGIDATEREMVRHCLTTADGTANLGLWRGLVIKTAGTAWRPRVVRASAGELRRLRAARCVFSISLQGQGALVPGGRHSVVLFRFNEDGSADIGDPFAGQQRWSPQHFDELWPGEGVTLVQR